MHISSNLPFVAKHVMEKPTRRPSLTQTAMAGARVLLKHVPHKVHLKYFTFDLSGCHGLEVAMKSSRVVCWLLFKMMRLGRGGALLRPLTEIQMQKKLQVGPINIFCLVRFPN